MESIHSMWIYSVTWNTSLMKTWCWNVMCEIAYVEINILGALVRCFCLYSLYTSHKGGDMEKRSRQVREGLFKLWAGAEVDCAKGAATQCQTDLFIFFTFCGNIKSQINKDMIIYGLIHQTEVVCCWNAIFFSMCIIVCRGTLQFQVRD